MRVRVALPVLVAMLLGASPAPAAEERSTVSCAAESLVRFNCSFAVPPGEYRTMYNGTPTCDKFRDFSAEPSSGRYDGSAFRALPASKFTLKSKVIRLSDDETVGTMRVVSYVNATRVKFRNTSKFSVEVEFSMRCESVNF